MYAASLLIVTLFCALLLQIGSQPGDVTLTMLVFIASSYIFAGFIGKTMNMSDFQFAARQSGRSTGAQAIASGVISSGIFVLLAGMFYQNGISAFAYFSGWLLGIALMALLFASGFCRERVATVPALFTADGVRSLPRLIVLAIVVVCCSLLLLSQMEFITQIAGQYFGFSPRQSIVLSALAIGFATIVAGIRGVTIIRAVAYPVLVAIFLLPLIWISIRVSGIPIPQLSFGFAALQPISEIDLELVDAGIMATGDVFDISRNAGGFGSFDYLMIMACIAIGTASMPHLLMHFGSFERGRDARRTGFLSFILVLLFLSAVPAVAAFVRFDIYTSLLGLQLSDLEASASWVFSLSGDGNLPLISLCGKLVSNVSETLAACGGNSETFLSLSDIQLNPDLIVLASSILHGLPELVTILIATGALLALFTTCDGLFFIIALSISNDAYQNMIRPQSPHSVRLFMTRLFLLLVIIMISLIALKLRPDPKFMFEASLALSAAGLFPILINRFWGLTQNRTMQAVACLTGFGITTILMLLARYGTDLILASGDELQALSGFISPAGANFSYGIIGAFCSGIILICYGLYARKLKSTAPHEVENAPA
jgi:cation/acetate symporter